MKNDWKKAWSYVNRGDWLSTSYEQDIKVLGIDDPKCLKRLRVCSLTSGKNTFIKVYKRIMSNRFIKNLRRKCKS